MTPKRSPSSKSRILAFFLGNVGRVLTSAQIRTASGGASEWARRVRELRDEEGYQILTHRDRADLKPGQYLLLTNERRPVIAREISKQTRAFVLERNGYTCQMCGLAAGDPDPYAQKRTVRLTMGHILDKSLGGDDTPGNLRAVCTNCNEGLAATSPPTPDRLEVLRGVRRATNADQLFILDWLKQKFENLPRGE